MLRVLGSAGASPKGEAEAEPNSRLLPQSSTEAVGLRTCPDDVCLGEPIEHGLAEPGVGGSRFVFTF
jgi:hypothetical protein